jgi:phosphoglycerate dehydrogenase-like enzyme
MAKKTVVVAYKAPPPQKALFEELLGSACRLVCLTGLAAPERARALESAEVLLSWNVPRELAAGEYALLGRAALLQLLSAGADHVPFADLPEHLVVASNAGAYAGPMAEHVLAMTLALAKRLLLQNEKLKRGEFDQSSPNRVLRGMAAGIIGFGGIGRATARLMRPFGMKILALNSTGHSDEPADFVGTLMDLSRVLVASDVVVLCLPLMKLTRNLIGRRELELMKPEAILINVARAGLVDEEALFRHAKDHPGFQAGIDAWWSEPFAHGAFHMEFPFLDLPNVLGSPHNSAVVPSILEDGARSASANILRFLRGEPLAGVVKRDDYV